MTEDNIKICGLVIAGLGLLLAYSKFRRDGQKDKARLKLSAQHGFTYYDIPGQKPEVDQKVMAVEVSNVGFRPLTIEAPKITTRSNWYSRPKYCLFRPDSKIQGPKLPHLLGAGQKCQMSYVVDKSVEEALMLAKEIWVKDSLDNKHYVPKSDIKTLRQKLC